MRGPSGRIPLALRIAAWLLPSDVREEVLGDLLEAWQTRRREQPRWRRALWLTRQPMAALRARFVQGALSSGIGRGSSSSGLSRSASGLGRGASSDVRHGIVVRRPGFALSWLDVRLGARMLGKRPVLTVVAGLTLALGIPASLMPTHVLGLFERGTFPVEDGDRIVGIRNWDTEADRAATRPLHDLAVWKEELRSFESLGAARSDPYNVHSPDGRAAEVRGAEVTASVFDMLRVPPLLGRTLIEADEVDGAEDVVVISADLWASRFARDPEIVGKTIGIGRMPHTVVGVMPDDFLFPWLDHLWLPLRADPDDYAVGAGPDLLVFGRLADGVSREEAALELETVGGRLAQEWPETHQRLRPELVSASLLTFGARAAGLSTTWEMLLIQLFSFSVLAVACGNVGVLILARTATRTNEISVRTALGASRTRILSQLFTESLVLSMGATAVGLFLAQALTARYAKGLLGESLPYWFDLGISPRTAVLAMGLAAACAVVAGVLPAVTATSPNVQQTLQRNAAGTNVRFGAFTTLLVVAEVALSVGFLSFGTAAVISFTQDRTEQAAIDIDRYLTARVRTPWVDPTVDETEAYEQEFRTRIAANHLALRDRLRGDGDARRVAMGLHLPGWPYPDQEIVVGSGNGAGGYRTDRVVAGRVHVDFFRDLGIDVLSGRDFSSADVEGGRVSRSPWAVPSSRRGEALRTAVVVNDQFVDKVLGGGEAVGLQLRYTFSDSEQPGSRGGAQDYNVWYEIVGVVETFGTNVENPARSAAVYHPVSASEVHPMGFILEVTGESAAFIPRLRRIAAEVDPELMIQTPRTLREVVNERRTRNTISTLFIVLLSSTGVILASTGLYALVSFTVSQRTREIGIRTALGARGRDVMATIARRALFQLAGGLALGSLLGWWILSLISDSSEFAVSSVPALLLGVCAGVIAVTALACLRPTLRGLRIQPTEALREA